MLNKSLGVINGDKNNGVVVFNRDVISRMAKDLGIPHNLLLARYTGVECDFNSAGGLSEVSLDRVTFVDNDGDTYSSVIMGLIPVEDLVKAAIEDDMNFQEFLSSHRLFSDDISDVDFDKIVEEYREQ